MDISWNREMDEPFKMKKIVKPPGGEASDIFGGGSPVHESPSPRKSHNHMQSSIFSPDMPDAGSPVNGHSGPTTPVRPKDSHARLFGEQEEQVATPRKVVNRQRSSIFEEEVGARSTPARRESVNPITGIPSTPSTPNGGSPPNGVANGHNGVNGYNGVNGTNGHTNGYANGHSSPASPMNGSSPRVRNPPGGKSSGIF